MSLDEFKYHEEVLEILKRNIGEDIEISAGYKDVEGKLLKITKNFARLKLDKKKVVNIRLDKIYSITETMIK
jgi:hypothetical protein